MSEEDIIEHTEIWSSPSKGGTSTSAITTASSTFLPTSSRNLGSIRKSPIKKQAGAGTITMRRTKRKLLDRIEVLSKNSKEESESEKSESTPILKPARKRGRPRKIPEPDIKPEASFEIPNSPFIENKKSQEATDPNCNLLNSSLSLEIPSIPAQQKDTPSTRDRSESPVKLESSLSTHHDFTSPLKQVILDNLKEYKGNISPTKFTLNRNFIPTPVPPKTKFKGKTVTINRRSQASTFFDTYEGYFDQRKSLRVKLSKNSLAQAQEISRQEFSIITDLFGNNLHKSARDKLRSLQEKMFPQFWLELNQGFSLLFYGVGSKRLLLEDFAIKYLSPKITRLTAKTNLNTKEHPVGKLQKGIPCLVINGYNPTCNYRDIYQEVLKLLQPEQELSRSETKFWGNHVLLHIQKLIEIYKTEPPLIKLIIVVHNLDGPSVRKVAFQTMLSYLSRIRQVALIASTDHIYAPVLWDNNRSENFNFVFHDVTNFESSSVETSFHDVMKIGKSESSTGAQGAKYVLQSLTVNSKKLFKLLIECQLSNMESHMANTKGVVPPSKKGTPTVGIEFKIFAQMCATDFIASSDSSLRSMLSEFVEHKMATVSKNNVGTELIWIPYGYAEMVKLLESVLKDI
ncbi:hypothetical protein TBLA_0E02600 [Henningerozyma blattae CBS 6284]|uniref:Origin recognition complex subunit 2 n=1 Tax=Henningerozyma blattae (strain ATCC 34711 / CBS 6284 / DSM 70876 / NBRC 10599 / NRRL Y-10934 / UCD 77-7) TaxID=1071380 RepID=I2H4L4_HENB6|nr:hypothetical protein TBLA_0E02600 [Tetrapisispora blattae CBS 6284]CCH61316.1 hypothetical protein TBLA_0E02600 [Tetrapisispora blattae CBS 6284]